MSEDQHQQSNDDQKANEENEADGSADELEHVSLLECP